MKAYIEEALRQVLRTIDGVPEDFRPELEKPNNPEHGDLATNAAMQLARYLKRPPRQIAEEIAERLRALPLDPRRVASVEVAGPGFLNFRFAPDYLAQVLADILAAGERYGRSDLGQGRPAIVEYVSANPTGPLTVGHGRNAVLGDTIANLLDWIGYRVTREYYYNDAGRQMRVLGESVRARYLALVDPNLPTKKIQAAEGEWVEVPEPFPEDGYLGDYIIDIARMLYEQHGEALRDVEDITPFKEAAEKVIFEDIRRTLARLGIHMDSYFNEHTLYENGKIWEVVEALRAKGYIYEKDGAVWFRTSALGKDQDTVLVKRTGEPTYRLPDIAYHITKFERGFERIVDVFGADHIATYPDVLRALEVLGYDVSKVDVVIYQFVTLVRGGEPVKMSTRKATYVTLDELIDEVGEDVTRFFFLMRSPNTHLEFDLDLAREASEKNPVFYLQYAHARICSIMRKADEVGLKESPNPDLTLLQHEAEQALIKELMRFPEVIQEAAQTYEPHRVANYLREVAVAFTKFYDHCRIIGEPEPLAQARLALARAARLVLANGLRVLGISAPERM
ncbi:arginine--tRNA ligase [Rhodothermus marinus]|uniref:Arginine--tRNA ligase n=1 Tax=Rhodothermus marinus (strain ATCC 43812 / DSM 4252 / R-10) TaxID=518766 RepID=D0MFK4_RHOM4|nr:arginine--tRNA ligase [Rhodothermus marinus]ACY47531.1 arginyl-tRNA synthetase [Rhodothermus marinus DSM 4252]AEN74146.1 arginyl-tRNA synthetase [Rhodothermus marinus SG0.5JP17-172]